MSKKSSADYRLCISSKPFLQMIRHCVGHFPYESGGLLIGDPLALPTNQRITDVYRTSNRGTKRSWHLLDHHHIAAIKRAGNKGKTISGLFHSHPYQDEISPNGSMLSVVDGITQEEYSLPISIIVAICPEGVYVTAWKLGFSAPLDIFIEVPGEKQLMHWDSFLSNHLDFSWYGKLLK